MAINAGLAALLILAASAADAQRRPMGPRNLPLPAPAGPLVGYPYWVVEREVPVIVEREVIREVPVPAEPPPPAPTPRKPYAVGASYDSLPSGCMKMIEGSQSYYWCSGGEWYRAEGKQFKAIAKP